MKEDEKTELVEMLKSVIFDIKYASEIIYINNETSSYIDDIENLLYSCDILVRKIENCVECDVNEKNNCNRL